MHPSDRVPFLGAPPANNGGGLAAWTLCVDHFKHALSPQQFTTWIAPLSASLDAGSLSVFAPNPFIHKWVKDRFWTEITELLSQNGEVGVRLLIAKTPKVLDNDILTLKSQVPSAALPPSVGRAEAPAYRTETPPTEAPVRTGGDARLLEEHTFASFVSGKANQLALAAAKQVADNPGGGYNPLFIYGGVGLGKTHLIQAVGHQVLANHPGARVRYMHSERYVQDVMKAYQRKSFDEFKSSYRSLDVLLIDDIQFFEGKERTQEEFFYLFNTLIEARKQIILTSDTFPKEIVGLDERLRSRFGWGLTVQLEPPETEMRVAILLSKAKAVRVDLDETVAFFVAKQVRSNVRELEGALKRIIAYASFHNVTISLTVAKEALRDLLAAQNRQVSIENIQKTVADYYKLKVADMHSKTRTRSVARPRQVAMYLTKELTRLSLPEIGQSFGGRDHTTVLHAHRQITALRESDPTIARDCGFLLQVLRG
jgi:chromosomal replication initiator protein